MLCPDLLLIRASMPINTPGTRRNSYPVTNIPMCITNRDFKHPVERRYSESIFIIVNITLFSFLFYMSWIKCKQDSVCYLHQKMPDLYLAHILHGWTDRTELVIMIPKTKGIYEKNRVSCTISRDGARTHFMHAYTLVKNDDKR